MKYAALFLIAIASLSSCQSYEASDAVINASLDTIYMSRNNYSVGLSPEQMEVSPGALFVLRAEATKSLKKNSPCPLFPDRIKNCVVIRDSDTMFFGDLMDSLDLKWTLEVDDDGRTQRARCVCLLEG